MRAIVFAAMIAATPAMAQTAPAPTTVVEPARQAAAERAVAALVPNGIYMTMMRDKFPAIMDMMMAKMGGMTAADMGAKSGDTRTFAQTATAADPAFDERMRITTRVMSDEMGKVFGTMEPRLRSGLAKAFARKFSQVQLDDMNRFFATPSGSAFAAQYLLSYMEPEVMQEMMGAMPEMLKAMPAMMAKVQKATAHLPQPRTAKTGTEK